MSGRTKLASERASNGRGAPHRKISAAQDHREGQLRQGEAGQTHPHRQGGRHQDHRQNTGTILQKNTEI